MQTDATADQRDWILVDRASGFITRGLRREEVCWITGLDAVQIQIALDEENCCETRGMIIVGEWRRK